MKYALIIDGVVDTVALDRPGRFVMEAYKEAVTRLVPREVETLVPVMDLDGNPAFEADGQTPLTRVEISTVDDEVTEEVDRERQVFAPDERFIECPDDVFGGYLFDGADYAPPPAAAPSSDPSDYPLNRFQFEAFVLSLGLSMAALETAVNGLALPAFDKAVALSRLRNAASYNYSHPLVEHVRVKIGMSKTQLTENWMLAKDLR